MQYKQGQRTQLPGHLKRVLIMSQYPGEFYQPISSHGNYQQCRWPHAIKFGGMIKCEVESEVLLMTLSRPQCGLLRRSQSSSHSSV